MSEGRLLVVCTGNICRSPAIERVLAARLPELDVTSAGTQAVVGHPISSPMVPLIERAGGTAGAFAARQLTAELLAGVDLVLTAARGHRAVVVSLAPALVRRTFTLRELARLLAAAGPLPGTSVAERLAAVPQAAAAARPHAAPSDDDVVDPIGRPPAWYQRSVDQMLPAIETVVAALTGAPEARAAGRATDTLST